MEAQNRYNFVDLKKIIFLLRNNRFVSIAFICSYLYGANKILAIPEYANALLVFRYKALCFRSNDVSEKCTVSDSKIYFFLHREVFFLFPGFLPNEQRISRENVYIQS